MEILRKNINFDAIVKRAPRRRSSVAVSSVLVLSGLMPGGVQAEGITSHVNAQLSKDDTHTLVLYKAQTPNTIVTFPSPTPLEIKLSPNEQRIQALSLEVQGILYVAVQNLDVVKPHWVDDLPIYAPIYLAAAEKYGIDWKVLWINHEFETGASALESKAFDTNSPSQYEGGMQIGPTWSEEYMNDAFSELEYLDSFPQRHEGDARNIATAAKMIAANYNKYKNLGEEKAYFNAIKLFTGSEDLAMQRMEAWITLNEIYPSTVQ